MSELKPARKVSIENILRKEFKARGFSDISLCYLFKLHCMQPVIEENVLPQEIAEKLAKTFGTSVELWVNLGRYNE